MQKSNIAKSADKSQAENISFGHAEMEPQKQRKAEYAKINKVYFKKNRLHEAGQRQC